jgi:hypothetical protein
MMPDNRNIVRMVDRLQKWTLKGGVIEQFEYFHGRIIE